MRRMRNTYRMDDNMFASTTFQVRYIDKYLKDERVENFTVNLNQLSTNIAKPAGKESRSTKVKAPKTVHIESKVSNLYHDFSEISVSYGKNYYHVENVKTNSKDLKAKLVQTYNYAEYGECRSRIGLYAEKNGEYVVMFDVCNSSGKKLGCYEVKVYAYPNTPIKSVSFAGKSLKGITKISKGKLSVTMNSGYKLKKFTVKTYNKNGKQ